MNCEPTLTGEELAKWDDQIAYRREHGRVSTVIGVDTLERIIAALRASRAEVERLVELADFARLLGPARMVLDRCAELAPGYQAEAADMAQRIVDLIGHPVTDEPPHALVERDELRSEVERLREMSDGLYLAVQMGGKEQDRLSAEVERLRAGLDFYADPANWDAHRVPNADPAYWESGAAIDAGERARRTLNVPAGIPSRRPIDSPDYDAAPQA